MTNIERGEVPLDIKFKDGREDHFVLKFSNAGHRSMEDFLDKESSEIIAKINTGRLGPRIVTAMFWGATRKFHRDDFETISDIDAYMDKLDNEGDDDAENGQAILIALVAAYTRSNPSDIEASLMGEEKEVPSGASANGNGTGKGRGKKPAKKPAVAKKEAAASGETS